MEDFISEIILTIFTTLLFLFFCQESRASRIYLSLPHCSEWNSVFAPPCTFGGNSSPIASRTRTANLGVLASSFSHFIDHLARKQFESGAENSDWNEPKVLSLLCFVDHDYERCECVTSFRFEANPKAPHGFKAQDAFWESQLAWFRSTYMMANFNHTLE